ncbi:MAG: hypothetical protein NTY47_09160 [Candidatus Omnitrophica bacterium]|nr:hypothetical protein [Candidatus Omnitrophota bacterium]
MFLKSGNSDASYRGNADFDDITLAVLQIYPDQPTVEGNVRKIVDRVLKTAEKGFSRTAGKYRRLLEGRGGKSNPHYTGAGD